MADGGAQLKASVIVLAQGDEQRIGATLASLEGQSIDKGSIEAIFVGSSVSRGARRALRKFSKAHEWAQVLSYDAANAYEALNAGIDAAAGAGIFFVKEGDELSSNAIKDVTKFLEKHDDLNLIALRLERKVSGETVDLPVRLQALAATGVFDLGNTSNCYLCPSKHTVCVRNRFEGNVHFDARDAERLSGRELAYIVDVLRSHAAMGYVSSAVYTENIDPSSAERLQTQAYFTFDDTLVTLEQVVSGHQDGVPLYAQALVADCLLARVREGRLLPTHLSGDDYLLAMQRLGAVLDQVSDEVLFSHPATNVHLAMYLGSLRNGDNAQLFYGPGGGVAIGNGSVVWSAKKIEVFLQRTRLHDGFFEVSGVIRTPFSAYTDADIRLYLCHEKGKEQLREELMLRESGESYYDSTHKTASFLAFRAQLPLKVHADYSFMVTIDGIPFETRVICKRSRVTFGVPLNNTVVTPDALIILRAQKGVISIADRTKKAYGTYVKKTRRSLDRKVRIVRSLVRMMSARLHRRYDEVWIYTDAEGRLDNAWLQFVHDAPAADGVMRYYVARSDEMEKLEAPKSKAAKVIAFGSWEHRIIHWVADRRLVSDISGFCISPWDSSARTFYADYDNAEVVYLQHGVLWAHLPWYYSRDKMLVDKMVVSTQFEIDNLTANYGFDEGDLIASGMPRYDLIEHDQPAEKKVLLCPSWRSYLVGSLNSDGREPLDDLFLASDYFKNLDSLLHDERLRELLQKHGYTLDFKLHPNFACYAHLFKDLEGPVRLVDSVEHEHAYAAIITDYSSYSFDFAYLNRAIIYYIPDEELFRAGVSNYSELDMDLDDALGEHAKTAEEAIAALEHVLEYEGKPVERFAEKEADFFLHYDNNQRDRLREALRG